MALAKYTDKVYVTTVVSDSSKGYQSMNGDIVVIKDEGKLSISCSNNNTLFKDTEWFKQNRTLPDFWKTEE